MAVPRRSGNLEESVAAAVGCQSAVPKPMSTLAANATHETAAATEEQIRQTHHDQ